jgi:hypothetical protein
LVQVAPLAHALPHPPQFAVSEPVVTHRPLQSVAPGAHAQTPAVHS